MRVRRDFDLAYYHPIPVGRNGSVDRHYRRVPVDADLR